MKPNLGVIRIVMRACFAVAIAGTSVATQAAEIFLHIPGIQGESTVSGHQGQIDLLSYSQSFRAGDLPTAGGGGAGRSTCGEVIVTKQIDRSSPRLIAAVLQSRSVGRADITFRGGTGTASDYYTVELSDVFITSIEQTDQPDPQRIVERVSLRARAFTFAYRRTLTTGFLAPAVQFGWDCDAQTSLR